MSTQELAVLLSALLTCTAACGSHDNTTVALRPTPQAVYDAGVDAQAVAVGTGFGSSSTQPAPTIVLPPTSAPYQVDHTGASGLPASVVESLRASAKGAGAGASGANGGANANSSNCSELLYPYEGTVMPGGLISPPLMFTSAFDAAYVRAGYVNTDRLDYEFAVGSASPGELRVPAEDWANIVSRTQGTPLTLTFAFLRSGSISTCVARLGIANGNMTGSIYYNTYNHPQSAGTGAILRLTLGEVQPEVYLKEPLAIAPVGPCVGCHSLSVQGNTLAASTHLYAGSVFQARSYKVGSATQPAMVADIKDAAFGGVTPDGKAILRMGNPSCTQGADIFPRAANNFPMAIGPTAAGLISMETGNDIPSTGLLRDHFYWMPQFSPDGNKLVFNDARIVGGTTERRELAIADYDAISHTFSAPRPLVSAEQLEAHGINAPSRDYSPKPIVGIAGLAGGAPGADGCIGSWDNDPSRTGAIPKGSCDGPCYPGWPFFTPDGKGVIFALVSEPDFSVAFPGREAPSKSELWYVDVSTRQMVRLDNANRALPGADVQDNYYPTVLPVQVGGYYWLFWTSRRDFGHRVLAPAPDAQLTSALIGSSAAAEAFRKRIWVSAIVPPGAGEFAEASLTDPSSPPFYLEGQSETGNTRAFAALNPCSANGQDCRSGLDCCAGYCNFDDSTHRGTCGDKVLCAKLNEKCLTAADCCPPVDDKDQELDCIAGYCGFLVVR